MKVLVSNPPWESKIGFGCRSNTRWPHIRADKYLIFPIYLAYTAAVLEKAGIDVVVVDAVAQDYDSDKFVARVKQENPEVCFLESATPSIAQDLKNANRIKSELGIKVFLMGVHPTIFHGKILKKNPGIDGIIRGEFEYTARDIAMGIAYNEILGLSYNSETGVKVNEDRPYIEDLDSLPFPAWHKFNWDKYESHLYVSPSMWIISSRGCPFKCSFCVWPDLMYGHKQRYRSAKNVVDEIETLINKYHVKEVRFDDDTFALRKSHVMDICDEIMKRGIHKKIRWACFGHASRDDIEMYSKLKEAGCFRVDFGIESGSPKIQEMVSKNLDIEKVKRTVSICKQVGLEVYCDFMIGFPFEDEQDIKKTINLALGLDTDLIQASFVIPYPGTRMYNEGIEKDYLIYPYEWEKYDCNHALIKTVLTQKEVENYYFSLWKRYYLRPRIIFKKFMQMFKSWQDFKRVLFGFVSFAKRYLK